MTIKDLVGFQLVGMNDECIVVSKGDKVYTIEFECDEGDCCGYYRLNTALHFDPNETKNNPVITDVVEEVSDDGYYNDCVNIHFFGVNKKLATIEAEAGSGSGWAYGAFVAVKCKALKLEHTIAEW